MKNKCLKLLYEVAATSSIRIGVNDFFGKILLSGVRAKRDQNGPKMRFYKFHEQLTLKFSENLQNIRVACGIKIDSSNSNNVLLVLRF